MDREWLSPGLPWSEAPPLTVAPLCWNKAAGATWLSPNPAPGLVAWLSPPLCSRWPQPRSGTTFPCSPLVPNNVVSRLQICSQASHPRVQSLQLPLQCGYRSRIQFRTPPVDYESSTSDQNVEGLPCSALSSLWFPFLVHQILSFPSTCIASSSFALPGLWVLWMVLSLDPHSPSFSWFPTGICRVALQPILLPPPRLLPQVHSIPAVQRYWLQPPAGMVFSISLLVSHPSPTPPLRRRLPLFPSFCLQRTHETSPLRPLDPLPLSKF